MCLTGRNHREAVFLLIDADIDNGDAIGLEHFLNDAIELVGRFSAQADAAIGFGEFDEVGQGLGVA